MCVNLFPMRLSSSVTGRDFVMMIPCGKCVECKKDRQNSWKLRLCEESKNWAHFYFFTLTYSDDNVPYNVDEVTGEVYSTNCKKHIQDWVKRIRESLSRKYGKRLEFKYFICSEYGPRGSRRPHYHGVFMTDVDYKELKPLVDTWMFGYYDFTEVVPRGNDGDSMRAQKSSIANYISKYCCKFGKCSRQKDIDAGRCDKEWSVMSKGIGESYIVRMKDWHLCGFDWSCDEYFTEQFMYEYTRHNYCSQLFNKLRQVVERGLVCDGEYQYKMPRYYKDRIYAKSVRQSRVTCTGKCSLRLGTGKETPEYRPLALFPIIQPIEFHVSEQQVVRYCHENFLSLAIRCIMAFESDARYWQRLASWKESNPELSDTEFVLQDVRCREAAKQARRIRSEASLSRFYTSNMFRNRALNFA